MLKYASLSIYVFLFSNILFNNIIVNFILVIIIIIVVITDTEF